MGCYLGIDVGSVSTNVVMLDQQGAVLREVYLPTGGDPLRAVQAGLGEIKETPGGETRKVLGVGTTGSGRQLAGVFVGADLVKNEITSHAVGAINAVPDVRTILEIGGQDSKIIILRDGIVVDFAMNTVCAAGTGSFLDRQASRLGISIEEFGRHALEAPASVRIAGRCAVFAESDMIHKQQVGHKVPEIVRGLCDALVRNYLNNVGKGKEIAPPVVFQGGVACNAGMKRAFENALGMEVLVPQHNKVMGAVGVALLVKEDMALHPRGTAFRGWSLSSTSYSTRSFCCEHCSNRCEIAEVFINDILGGRWGGRCDRWEQEEVRRVSAG